MERVEMGFVPANILSLRLALPGTAGQAADWTAAYQRLEAHVRTVPGIADVAFSTDLPVPNPGGRSSITIEHGGRFLNGDAEHQRWTPGQHAVSADYFRALTVPIVRGRGFSEADDVAASPVAIVSEETARRHWPGADPVGQRVSFGARQRDGTVDEPWMTIVGVARDIRFGGPEAALKGEIFTPLPQSPRREVFMLARTSIAPSALAAPIRETIAATDPGIVILDLETMDRRFATVTADARIRLAVLSWFALLAGVLTVVGLHVAVAARFVRRRRELALRAALGATRANLMRFVLRHAVRLVLPATMLGLFTAAMFTRLLTNQLFQVHAFDAVTFVVVGIAAPVAAFMAAAITARQTCRVDPTIALRHE